MVSLREYQQDHVKAVRDALIRHRRVIMTAPPGAGKTRMAKHIIDSKLSSPAKDGQTGRVLFAVHRRGLVENASQSFLEDPSLDHGLIMSGIETSFSEKLQVASIDTLNSWWCDGGEFKGYTFDLIIFDECITGDSIIETEKGVMRIDEVPTKKPTFVKSYSKENGVELQRIKRFWDKGTKETIVIHTHYGKIQCTGSHLIFTRRGWVQAKDILNSDEILASAVAEKNQETLLRGDANQKTRLSLQKRISKTCLKEHQNAYAVAVKKLDLRLRTPKNGCLQECHRRQLIMRLGMLNAGHRKLENFHQWKGNPYSEHCLETHRLGSHMQCQKTQELAALTVWFKKTGQNIRRQTSKQLVSKQDSQKTKGMGNGLFNHGLDARLYSCRSLIWLQKEGKKRSPKNGLTKLVRLGLHGGYAMTAHLVRKVYLFTQRGLVSKKTKLYATGLKTITEKHQLSKTKKRGCISSALPVGHRLQSQMQLENMSQSVCSINYAQVTLIEKGNLSEVYDIEVEKTHCFFANGLLVHNCHSHCTKLQTFLKHHDEAREAEGNLESFLIGLSATPQGEGLSDTFKEIVSGPEPSWLIEQGYLKPFKYYNGTAGKLDRLVRNGQRFTSDSNIAAMEGLNGELVRDWERFAEGRATVGFFSSRANARHAKGLLQKAGIRAEYVDGETPDDKRRLLYKLLNQGDINYLANVGVVERGTDIPRVSCVQLCTAIGSIVRYRQMIGRASRPHPGVRDACILDHGGNIDRHGFFDDPIEWSLERKITEAKDAAERPTLECPNCGRKYRGGRCMECDYEPTQTERKKQGLEFDGTELKEVTKRNPPKPISNEALMLQALYAAGRSGRTIRQAVAIAYRKAKDRNMQFRVPRYIEVAGNRIEMVRFNSPDQSKRVAEVYEFTRRK